MTERRTVGRRTAAPGWCPVVVVALALLAAGCGGAASAAKSTRPPTTTTTLPPAERVPPGPPSDQRSLSVTHTLSGPISPKSVASSSTGLIFAQNMMYRHSVTVYSSAGSLVKTIPDSVDPVRLRRPGPSRGDPGCPGGGGLHPRLALRVRLQLLHVRDRIGPRGERLVHPAVGTGGR